MQGTIREAPDLARKSGSFSVFGRKLAKTETGFHSRPRDGTKREMRPGHDANNSVKFAYKLYYSWKYPIGREKYSTYG